MKTKYTMLMLAMGLSVAALAQENDDMYFNSKDRAVVVKANEVVLAKKYRQDDLDAVRSNPVNPSDSYSGRGVNPEYNAQAKNGTSVVQNDPDYFLTGYQPKNVNSNLYNNTSAYSNTYYNNGYGSSYGYSGFGSPYSSMYSPYGYSPYSMMSPYSMYSPYGGMYGMGMGMGMGGMYSGFGMGYSMMYGSPYSMMGFGYGMGSMYGYGSYGYGSYYPSTVIVTGGDGGSVGYGRRASRSSGMNNNYVGTSRNGSTVVGSTSGSGRVLQGGRVSSSSQPNYYNSGWRNSGDFSNSRSGYSNGNGLNGSSSGHNSWGNGGNSRSSYDSFGSGSRGSFGGHSGGFSGGGGGGFSGGGGGGHSRGRN